MDSGLCASNFVRVASLNNMDLSITANNSTEGATKKFPFLAIFYPRERMARSDLNSGPFELKPR